MRPTAHGLTIFVPIAHLRLARCHRHGNGARPHRAQVKEEDMMNRAERRAAMRGPKPNACRRIGGVFTDGQRRYAWTLDNGGGLIHDHRDGRCPFGCGGKYEGRAEQVALGLADMGCGCGERGEVMTFGDLLGCTEEQADAAFDWAEADDDTLEYDNAVERLIELAVDLDRAFEILDVMVAKRLIITLCADCEENHGHELPSGPHWIHRATRSAA